MRIIIHSAHGLKKYRVRQQLGLWRNGSAWYVPTSVESKVVQLSNDVYSDSRSQGYPFESGWAHTLFFTSPSFHFFLYSSIFDLIVFSALSNITKYRTPYIYNHTSPIGSFSVPFVIIRLPFVLSRSGRVLNSVPAILILHVLDGSCAQALSCAIL